MAEGKACPASGLMDEGLMLDRVKDGFKRVFDGQDEAS